MSYILGRFNLSWIVILCLLSFFTANDIFCAVNSDVQDKLYLKKPVTESKNCSKGENKYIDRANSLYKLKEFKKAIDYYSKAILINSQCWKAYEGRGISYFYIGKYLNANADFVNALKINSNAHGAYNGRAMILIKTGFYDYALEQINKAIKICPQDDESLWINKGTILEHLKKHNKSIKAFSMAIKINPNSKVAFLKRSISRVEADNIDEALDDLEAARNIDPNDPRIYRLISSYASRENDREKEMWALDKLVEVEPDNDKNYFSRGLERLIEDDFKLSYADFDRAIKINPNNPEYFYYRGKISILQKDLCKGISDLKHALLLQEGYTDAKELLARSYIEIGDDQIAKTMLDNLLLSKPHDIDILNTICWLLATSRNDDIRDGSRAVKLLKPFIGKKYRSISESMYISILDTFASALAETKNFDAAVRIQKEVVNRAKTKLEKEALVKYENRLKSFKQGKPWRYKPLYELKCK